MAVFRHFNTDKDGWIAFDEFQAALVRLNFVGVQREVRGGIWVVGWARFVAASRRRRPCCV